MLSNGIHLLKLDKTVPKTSSDSGVRFYTNTYSYNILILHLRSTHRQHTLDLNNIIFAEARMQQRKGCKPGKDLG